MDRDPPHYLSDISSCNTPQILAWLACVGDRSKEHGVFVERWAAGALGLTWRHDVTRNYKFESGSYTDPALMWGRLDAYCHPRKRVVLFAFDLALQVRLSQAFIHLPNLGWAMNGMAMERTSAWVNFRDGERSLLMVDLRSWVNVDFNTLAGDMGAAKVSGDWHASTTDDAIRECLFQVGIIRGAAMSLLDWLRAEELGPFRPTGSGQSYAAFRRRFMTDHILVHDDYRQLEAERAAMHTGRCEAWQHGSLRAGPYVEFDMRAAYCTIARDRHLPAIARRHIRQPSLEEVHRLLARYAVLARITVDTDIPVIPCKHAGRTLWPVGEFDTWVWDPELLLAYTFCHNVTVHECYTYSTAPVLHEFSRWVLDGMDSLNTEYGRVPGRVLKHWSRCLVGRLGLRYRSWDKWMEADEVDMRLIRYVDCDDDTMTDMLVAGHDWFLLSDMSEAPHSVPQIPSWVMSECRARLWHAMLYSGLDHLVYVDTDSIVTDQVGAGRMRNSDWHSGLVTWTPKGEYRRMTIYGPRNIVAEDTRRVSGLPLTARQVAPLEFTGEVMRSVKDSLRTGQLDCVASLPRTFKLKATDLRRVHLPYNATKAVRLERQLTEDEV